MMAPKTPRRTPAKRRRWRPRPPGAARAVCSADWSWASCWPLPLPSARSTAGDVWLPLVDPNSGQQNQVVTEAVERLDGLEARLSTMQTELQAQLPPDNSAAISELGERFTTLEAALSQGAGQDPETRAALESLSANLARLTDRLQSIEEAQAAAVDPNEATEALASKLTGQLSSEAARLDELLTAQSELAARLEATERDLASAAASREAAPGSEETLMLLAMAAAARCDSRLRAL